MPLLPRRAPRPRLTAPAVLQLVPRLHAEASGAEAAVDVARALATHGWRALVASAGGPLERELRYAGGELAARLAFDAGGPVRHWQNLRAVSRVARQGRVLLLHARSADAALFGADLARRTGLPLVVTPHELPDPEARRDAPYRAALRAATRVIAVSEFAAEHLVNGLALPAERVAVVPRWVDLDEFDPDRVRGHRVAAAAERCGLGIGPRVIGVPAEVAAGDGRDLLAAAASRLQGRDFLILLLGRLPEGRDGVARLTAALGSAGLLERARFGTGVDDLPAALAATDVLLVPATRPHATAPLVTMAQAMGKPVVVTAVGALPEMVMPAVTGWLLPPDDPGEIAWALELALQMGEDVRERVARRAREFVAAGFGAAGVLEGQIGLYAALIGASKAAAATPAAPAHAAAE
jgi:glycosyltransferase involved in cell wall biosynthesis